MRTATTRKVETVAADIRGRRERLGLSRLALAAAAGCSNTYLAALEAGCLPRRGEVLARVLQVLKDHEETITAAETRKPPAAPGGLASLALGAKTNDEQAYPTSTGFDTNEGAP